MWQAICVASLVVALIRAFPAFFKGFERIKAYPRFNKVLDYTICLVTGEVIYSIAFKEIPANGNAMGHNLLTITTILLAATIMWYSEKLSKSLLISLSVFILGYCVFCR